MIRTGRCNVVYSGSVTWSSGSTATAALTLTFSLPASAGQTTLLHEIVFSTNCTSDITADVRPVISIGGSTVYGDLSLAVNIPGLSTIKGISVGACSTQARGLFNNATGIIGLLLSSAATATVTVNCMIWELEGT